MLLLRTASPVLSQHTCVSRGSSVLCLLMVAAARTGILKGCLVTAAPNQHNQLQCFVPDAEPRPPPPGPTQVSPTGFGNLDWPKRLKGQKLSTGSCLSAPIKPSYTRAQISVSRRAVVRNRRGPGPGRDAARAAHPAAPDVSPCPRQSRPATPAAATAAPRALSQEPKLPVETADAEMHATFGFATLLT